MAPASISRSTTKAGLLWRESEVRTAGRSSRSPAIVDIVLDGKGNAEQRQVGAGLEPFLCRGQQHMWPPHGGHHRNPDPPFRPRLRWRRRPYRGPQRRRVRRDRRRTRAAMPVGTVATDGATESKACTAFWGSIRKGLSRQVFDGLLLVLDRCVDHSATPRLERAMKHLKTLSQHRRRGQERIHSQKRRAAGHHRRPR